MRGDPDAPGEGHFSVPRPRRPLLCACQRPIAKPITAHTAAKAAKNLFFGLYHKRRGFFLMKRAASLQVLPHPLQGHVLSDQIRNVIGGLHLIDYVVIVFHKKFYSFEKIKRIGS